MSYGSDVQIETRNMHYDQHELLASIAISLKRIADAIEGDTNKMGCVQHLGETISNAIREGRYK